MDCSVEAVCPGVDCLEWCSPDFAEKSAGKRVALASHPSCGECSHKKQSAHVWRLPMSGL